MIVGGVVVVIFRPLGMAILGGAAAGYYASAIEKWIRMRPAPEAEPCAPPNRGPAAAVDNSSVTEGPPSVS